MISLLINIRIYPICIHFLFYFVPYVPCVSLDLVRLAFFIIAFNYMCNKNTHTPHKYKVSNLQISISGTSLLWRKKEQSQTTLKCFQTAFQFFYSPRWLLNKENAMQRESQVCSWVALKLQQLQTWSKEPLLLVSHFSSWYDWEKKLEHLSVN